MVQAGEPIGMPVEMDATASGIQILACLSGCVTTASAVNLIDTFCREDLYQEVANEMTKKLGSAIERADVKKPVSFSGFEK